MLKQSLIRLGYGCRTAGNGVEALSLCNEQLPDLILIDLNMPKMSGFELAEAFEEKLSCNADDCHEWQYEYSQASAE